MGALPLTIKDRLSQASKASEKLQILAEGIPPLLEQRSPELGDLVDQFRQLVDKIGDTHNHCQLACFQGALAVSRNQWRSAHYRYAQALALCTQHHDLILKIQILMRLAHVQLQLKEYSDAVSLLLEARQVNSQIKNRSFEAPILNVLATTYKRMGKSADAIHMYKQALEFVSGTGGEYRQGSVLVNLAAAYRDDGQFDQAEQTVLQAIPIFKKRSDLFNLHNCQSILSSIAVSRGEISQGLDHLNSALQLMRKMDNPQDTANVLINISQLLMQANRAEEGQEYCEEALALMPRIEIDHLRQKISYISAMVFAELDNPTRALTLFREYADISDDIYMRHESKLQKEVAQVMADMREELRVRRLEQDLELKNRELTAKTITIARKQEFLVELLENIQSARREGSPEVLSRCLTKISSQLKTEVSAVHVWEEFEKWFQEVHGHFYKSLQQGFPDLSNRERKICAFLKLKMQTKDIAALTNLSHRTVENHRSNIRRKLGLGSGENLVMFLETI